MSVFRLALCSAAVVTVGLFTTRSAHAQSITPAPDGTGTIIHHNGNTYHITGGTQAGHNLFQSFQRFNLDAGEVANFWSDPGVVNIFGRVVGGDPSIIDGLIRANPNLYLMNPAGIVFGANAQLNVGGDFFATTADQICFEGGCFNAVGVNDYTALLGSPTTLGFLQGLPGGLINAGRLEVQKHKSIHLSGSTVVNLGQIVAPGGMATVAAVPGERQVRLNQPGSLLSLEVTDAVLTEGIDPLALPELLTGSGRGNPPVVAPNPAGVSTGALPLQGDVVIAGAVEAEQVDLYAAGQVSPTDAGLVEGETRVIRFSEAGENPDQAVFIDERVDNPEQLLYGAAAGTVSQIIERDEDGVGGVSEQLSVISEAVGELGSVAVIAEGNQGNFWLGRDWVRGENIAGYGAQLQEWGAALAESADILLYSCFTALGATGEGLVASIAALTGADVAASVDVTGSGSSGGNWELEHGVGDVEAENPFTSETLNSWDGKLAVLTVQSAADDLVADGVLTFREALVAANNGTTVEGQVGTIGEDTIQFDTAGVFASPQTITTTLGEFVISDDLIIEGTGRDRLAFDGNSSNRVFNISANHVEIKRLTVQNGSSSSNGGGINGNSISVIASNISNNYARYGGGIHGNVTTVSNSIISGNSASQTGGGINSNLVQVVNSQVLDNMARSGGYVGTANITTGYGGGINGQNIDIRDSTISANHSGYGGGVNGMNLTIDGSIISGNTAYTRTFDIPSESTGGEGGGLNGNNIRVVNSEISGNVAGSGGGVNGSTVEVYDSTLSGNTAYLFDNPGAPGSLTRNVGADGGAVNSSNTVTINNSVISGNSAGKGGGINGNIVNIQDSLVTSNRARYYTGGLFSSSTIGSGGGINSTNTVIIQNSTISNNLAGKGGGIYGSDVNIQNSRITSNNARAYYTNPLLMSSITGSGGGINGTSSITSVNSTLLGNNAYYGGDVYSDTGIVDLNVVANSHSVNIDVWVNRETKIHSPNSVYLTGQVQTNGEALTIQSANNIDTTSLTLTTSSDDSGGDVIMNAGGDIRTRNLFTAAFNNGNGGDVNLSAQGSINTLNGSQGSIDARAANGDAGNVSLRAEKPMKTGPINTESEIGSGGSVFLESEQFVSVNGTVYGSFFDSNWASISSVGELSGGSITIRHGGFGLVPFKIGDAQLNGTSHAITAGNGFTIFTGNSFLFTHIQPGIQISTGFHSPEIISAVSGTTPKNQLDTEEIIDSIGRQAGGNAIFPKQGGFRWELPGEKSLGGSLEDNEVLRELERIDDLFGNQFIEVFELEEQEESEEEGSIANLREALRRIREQTGTVPVIVYALIEDKYDLEELSEEDRRLVEELELNSSLELLIITPEDQLIRKVVRGVTASELSRLTSSLGSSVQDFDSTAYLTPAQKLYTYLIAPIQPELEGLGVDTLIFAMSAGLRTLPLAALHDGNQFLIEQYSLGMIPSVSLTNSDYRSLKESPIVAMGASEFQALDPLPAVPTELTAITQTRPASRQFLNEAFTLDTLRRESQAQSYGIVHLATHAKFLPIRNNGENNSYIQFWDQDVGFQDLRDLGWHNDPQVELLVLSACETALGDPHAELGFAGLAVQTGVKSALASLWQVPDVGTLGLMATFYEQLNDPDITIKAEALRQAQLALLRGEVALENGMIGDIPLPPQLVNVQGDLTHPFFWSGFTIVGSPW
ncbi:MAG: CHAT domain-containing protein [Spirulinaceae cyanobacterium]